MAEAARRTIHIVVPGIDSVAALCALERAARTRPGVRRVTVLELRGGGARLALRVDASAADAVAHALQAAAIERAPAVERRR